MAKKDFKVSKNTPTPFLNNIIVSRKKPESVSKGGIILPEANIEDENEGYVLAVGPLVGKSTLFQSVPTEKQLIPAVGDKVFFGSNAGTTIKAGDEEFFLMRENDILCKL